MPQVPPATQRGAQAFCPGLRRACREHGDPTVTGEIGEYEVEFGLAPCPVLFKLGSAARPAFGSPPEASFIARRDA